MKKKKIKRNKNVGEILSRNFFKLQMCLMINSLSPNCLHSGHGWIVKIKHK